MKVSTIACITLCCGLMAGTPALAQKWSPVEMEVWSRVEAFADQWAAGNAEGILAYVHEDYIGWDINDPMTMNKAQLRKYVEYWTKAEKIVLHDLTPVSINVFDDVAIVHYHFNVFSKDTEGAVSYLVGRSADVLRKQDGKWMLIGDHGGVISDD